MPAGYAPFSVYIHIPYCISKCPYCDFNSHVVPRIPESQYTETLLRELDYYASAADWTARPVETLYFGGGTPSTFHPASIGRIVRHVAAAFPLTPDCEITLEANPGTVDERNFAGYREHGVNRISVGVQSFQPRLLAFLGRAHSAQDARRALATVRRAGFENFSFDLIYANPGQTLAELEADLDVALEHEPPHLSAYNLTFEERTPFHHAYRTGRLEPLPEDLEIAMAELIEHRLASAGLQRYEISNYAQANRYSRHNVNYWRSGDYLGIGAGAHSYKSPGRNGSQGRRWSNEENPARFMAAVGENGRAVAAVEEIDGARAAGEFMFLGLRMTSGVAISEFRSRFASTPVETYPRIADFLTAGLMEETAGCLRLTRPGLMVANSIFTEFM